MSPSVEKLEWKDWKIVEGRSNRKYTDEDPAGHAAGYAADGTMHVLITPQITGAQEAIEKAAAEITTPQVQIKFGWKPTTTRPPSPPWWRAAPTPS